MIDNHTRLKQTFKTYHIMLHKGLVSSVIVTSYPFGRMHLIHVSSANGVGLSIWLWL